MNTPNNITVGHAAYHPDCNLPSPAMIPTAPDCGAPCAMCETQAHLLAKARDEVARLREDKKRLDWLEAHGEPETFEDAPHALVWSVIGAPGERDVRVVIDAARKET